MLATFVGVVSMIGVLYFLMLRLNSDKYYAYVNRFNLQLKNEKLSKLLNSDTLGNLPSLVLSTESIESEMGIDGAPVATDDLNKTLECISDPVYLGPVRADDTTTVLAYEQRCLGACGSLGRVIAVTDAQEYYHKDKRLRSGRYCVVQDSAIKCNLRTGYIMADGMGSVLCKSKFPNMFGGPTASTIVACNNELHPSTGSLLWDYLNNAPVDPASVVMTDENETVPGPTHRFRFSCIFNDDGLNNRLIPHPANRFHPIKDPCTRTVVNAHRDARAVVERDPATGEPLDWRCECGDPVVTRLYHKDETDNKSTCTTCVDSISEMDENDSVKARVSYECFNVNSFVGDVNFSVPCQWENFIKPSTACDTIELTFYATKPNVTPFKVEYALRDKQWV